MAEFWKNRLLVAAIVVAFLAAFALWLVFPSKIECGYDGPGHIAQVWFYKYSIQNHLNVPWTNPYMWDGSLFLFFHAPFFYSLAGFLSLLVSQIIATKLLIFLSYILSVCTMYLLAKEYGLSRENSVLAGMLFTFSNWHLFSTFFRAAYLDSFGYSLLPLPFLYAKRGLEKNLVPFVISTSLLVLSHQVAIIYVMPALVVYFAILESGSIRKSKTFAMALLWFLLLVLFFFMPLAAMKGEAGPANVGSDAIVFDGGPTFPLNFVIPQWGIRYYEIYSKFWFFPKKLISNSSYVGFLHMLLGLMGFAALWRKHPELAGIVAVSFGFFLGIIPGINPHAAERVLFIFNVPLSIFIVGGIGELWKSTETKKLAAFGASLLVNVLGLGLMLIVYSERSGLRLPAAETIAAGLLLSLLLLELYRKRKLSYAALVILILALEVLPNAMNPTSIMQSPSQTDPCAYPTAAHEFLVNPRGVMCAMECDRAYLFQNQHFEIASKGIYSYWSKIIPDTSKCPMELGALGIGYCFQQGTATKIEPAKFISSTSNYTIERDEPDNLVIKFDDAGHSKVRLGYFSFYKASSGGRELELKESPEGFIEFDHPSGRVELKVVPPNSFKYSYLVSAISGIALLGFGLLRSKKMGRLEWLLLFGLAVVLAHVMVRLAWMIGTQ